MIFKPGPEGVVLVRNEFGDPVYGAGQVGRGRVIYSGCYYCYDRALEGAEAEVFWSCVKWLAGEGLSYWQPPVTDTRPHPALRWPERRMFR